MVTLTRLRAFTHWFGPNSIQTLFRETKIEKLNTDTSAITTAAQRPSHFFREFRAEQRRSTVAGWKFLKAIEVKVRGREGEVRGYDGSSSTQKA